MNKFFFSIPVLIVSLTLFPSNKDELKKINIQIKKIEKNINALKKEGTSVLNELYRIELEYKKAKKEEGRIGYVLLMTKKEIGKKKKEKKGLENNIEGLKKRIKKVLRILYKSGRVGNFKIFFNVKNIDQLFRNYQLFISLINYHVAEIEKIKSLIEKLNKVEARLREELIKQIKLKQSKKKKLEEISKIRKKKLNFISKINNDRKKYLSMFSDLQLEAEKLNRVINHESGKVDLPDIDLKKIKGKLDWPVKGRILTHFGKTKSTKFNTYVYNNGIEIIPLNSDKIKAVFPGVIIFQNYFKGYGNIVIVQHSKDLLTIYGHCEKFLKSKGDFVSTGEVVGIVGDSGSTRGKALYFEIRKGVKAVNPKDWLKR